MYNHAVMISFLVSIFTHAVLLGMPGNTRCVSQNEEVNEITIIQLEVEKPLLLPEAHVIGKEKRLQGITKKSKPQALKLEAIHVFKKSIEEDIEVVDSFQESILRYQDVVKQKIERERRYPSFAKRQGIEGTVYINFAVLSNGLSRDTKITRSSGFKILDQEAVDNIKRANPFPPIPKEINASLVQMEVSIVFTLK
ncbi:MAG: energy transducer TonB [Candidatus Omnitrophica bacterium]|nr:energy transducer TonB [Candidatus Omnitrophota bacterium]